MKPLGSCSEYTYITLYVGTRTDLLFELGLLLVIKVERGLHLVLLQLKVMQGKGHG